MEEIHWNFDNYGTFFVVLLSDIAFNFFFFWKSCKIGAKWKYYYIVRKKALQKITLFTRKWYEDLLFYIANSK